MSFLRTRKVRCCVLRHVVYVGALVLSLLVTSRHALRGVLSFSIMTFHVDQNWPKFYLSENVDFIIDAFMHANCTKYSL